MEAQAVDVAPLACESDALGREMDLLRSAIRMVAAHRSTRVIVAGIRYGELLCASGSRFAAELGVSLRAMPNATGEGIDFSVEPIDG